MRFVWASNDYMALDALRGVAAIIVAIGHVFDIYGHYNPFEHSHIAVDFFFILSGYVMARTYEGRLGTEIGTVQFLVIRFRRLWPPLAVGALIGLLPLWIAGYPVWSTLVLLCLALLLLPAAWDFGTYPLNPPAWSITLELIANIFHAAFLWRVGTRSLFALAAAWALIALFPGNPVLTLSGSGHAALYDRHPALAAIRGSGRDCLSGLPHLRFPCSRSLMRGSHRGGRIGPLSCRSSASSGRRCSSRGSA